MQSLFLIAEIAGSCIAVNSATVESVIHIGDIVPVPKCHPNIAGLVALRSRVLTLIDCQYAITNEKKVPKKGDLAIISEINGHFYGLLVDSVSEAIEIDPVSYVHDIKLAHAWHEITTNVARVGEDLLLIIDPSILVTGSLAQAA
jgi:purine-binding chemotaxis protein CheW